MMKTTQEVTHKTNHLITPDETCFLGVSGFVGGIGGAIGGAAVSSIATGSASTAVVGASCLMGCVAVPTVAVAAMATYKLFGVFCSANIADDQQMQPIALNNNLTQLTMSRS